MNCLMLVLILAAVEAKPAPADPKPAQATTQPAATDPKPLEDVLATEKEPNGKHIMVTTHILVHNAKAKGGMHVQFIDVKPTPAVNIKMWDPKLSELKPGTTILVTGELHYGTVKGGTPSVRYKVKEISGRVYNDHRHWRTDQAIYIINPTYVISAPPQEEPAKTAEPKS